VIVQDDMVAVQHYTSNGWNVSVDGTVYIFTPRRNVSMAWVRREHLEKILSMGTRGCCGGRRKRFHLASLINVNLWTYGERHKPEDATYKEI